MIQSQLDQVNVTYHETRTQFWTLTGASRVDALGGAMLFTFFTLYVSAKFGIGMAQVGPDI